MTREEIIQATETFLGNGGQIHKITKGEIEHYEWQKNRTWYEAPNAPFKTHIKNHYKPVVLSDKGEERVSKLLEGARLGLL